ncbi:hypothetical protein D3C78_1221220 [compost metagenome]
MNHPPAKPVKKRLKRIKIIHKGKVQELFAVHTFDMDVVFIGEADYNTYDFLKKCEPVIRRRDIGFTQNILSQAVHQLERFYFVRTFDTGDHPFLIILI